MAWGYRAWRRRRLLNRARLPENAWRQTLAELPLLRRLDAAERQRLRALVVLFLHEKSLQAAGQGTLDEHTRLRIAAQACLPILNLGLDYYRGWHSVIVYPGGFLARHEYLDEAGVVHDVASPLIGEAWEQGPVILSREDVNETTVLDGYNVVIHEFAHKLDMLTGSANGLPPLHRDMRLEDWSQAFTAAYEALCREVDAGLEPALDPYAAESPAEFFAIVSEAFFEIPDELQAVYPDVYRQLAAFYRQDPARRPD